MKNSDEHNGSGTGCGVFSGGGDVHTVGNGYGRGYGVGRGTPNGDCLAGDGYDSGTANGAGFGLAGGYGSTYHDTCGTG